MGQRQLNEVQQGQEPGHRIIECFGLEGTFRGHPALLPCNEQGHLQLDRVAQSPVQPGFECFQGWGFHYLSGQSVLAFHHPHGKRFLPYGIIKVGKDL